MKTDGVPPPFLTHMLLIVHLSLCFGCTHARVEQSQVPESLVGLPAKLRPVDETPKDPSLAAFKEELVGAAHRRDIHRVLSLFDPDVKVTDGLEGNGTEGLRREWAIDRSPSEFLAEVAAVVRLGGRFVSETEFGGPYVFTEFPQTDRLLPEFAVVISRDAPLYVKPDADAPVIARLDNDIVDYNFAEPGWVSVRLRDGRSGYMREPDVRSPANTRVRFKKVDGHWRVVEFNRHWD